MLQFQVCVCVYALALVLVRVGVLFCRLVAFSMQIRSLESVRNLKQSFVALFRTEGHG